MNPFEQSALLALESAVRKLTPDNGMRAVDAALADLDTIRNACGGELIVERGTFKMGADLAKGVADLISAGQPAAVQAAPQTPATEVLAPAVAGNQDAPFIVIAFNRPIKFVRNLCGLHWNFANAEDATRFYNKADITQWAENTKLIAFTVVPLSQIVGSGAAQPHEVV